MCTAIQHSANIYTNIIIINAKKPNSVKTNTENNFVEYWRIKILKKNQCAANPHQLICFA